MTNSEADNAEPTWETYYQWIEGRGPHPLFLKALGRFGLEPDRAETRHAIDLGFGDGTETLALLEAGWQVFAIDNEPAALKRLLPRIKGRHEKRLTVETASFEEVDPPRTDFLYAGLSLPFCRPAAFNGVWASYSESIRPGGRFAGQLFGIRDEWAGNSWMTFLSYEQVQGMFGEEFEVEVLREKEEDGDSSTGPKHWHLFEVIARK